jgi:chitodextrinase
MRENTVIKVSAGLIWCLVIAGMFMGCGTSAPTVPEGLVANVVSDVQINVSWNESTDYGEIDGYRVYRNGKFYFKQNGTSFIDAGLTNSTQYCYRVSAYDKVGNRSEKSDKACARTYPVADTTDPTTPANLNAVAADSSTIDLSWDPSTDNNGVIDHYSIYRYETDPPFIFLNDVNGSETAYSDSGLNAGTEYCYSVNAVDPSGNMSAGSNEDCATP